MAGKLLSVCGLALVFALPGLAEAGEVRLSIQDGRVALSARDATLRQILVEWERVGGTRIVNRDRVPGTLLTLDFANVPEAQALATLLRPIAGYVAAQRLGTEGGASRYSRIILMPGEAAPLTGGPAMASQGGAPPGMGTSQFGRPQVQRRVLPDGRVVTVMDDSQRAGEPDDSEDAAPGSVGAPGLMRPPFQAPQRYQQGQAVNDPTAPDPLDAAAAPLGQTAPSVAAATVATPGALPAAKPNPATTPGPPKPPGR